MVVSTEQGHSCWIFAEFAVVMSRHKTLDQAHLDTANSLLPEGEYRDSNQSDCPHHEHGEHAGHGHGGHASHEHGGHASHEHGEHASHEHGGHASHEHGGHAGHGHDH
ncbi:hypothetical protein PR048_004439 [Dryococelus australis]|uniref:Uncharacterized protein n=1 Tax=Dryococelus australis TaxID=614101 RepID=A0ABQ9I5G3_9NEOP|nr:hypothetical protein PR048_004439 [Dryococelus australis]